MSNRTMRLLAVSDLVQPQLYNNSLREWLPPVDLIISCGDLPRDYLDFLVSTLNVPLAHVIGNHCSLYHDPGTRRCNPDEYMGAFNLNAQVAEYKGLILAGIEGSPFYNGGPHQYSEMQIGWNLLKLTPLLLSEKMHSGRYLDVFVTHAPPRGIHDYDDVAHRGFELFCGFLQRFHPVLMLHGHSHRYDPMKPTHTRFGRTEIINVFGHSLIELAWEEKSSSWKVLQTNSVEANHGSE